MHTWHRVEWRERESVMGGGVAEGRVGGLIHNSHNYPQMLSHGAPSPSRFFFLWMARECKAFSFCFVLVSSQQAGLTVRGGLLVLWDLNHFTLCWHSDGTFPPKATAYLFAKVFFSRLSLSPLYSRSHFTLVLGTLLPRRLPTPDTVRPFPPLQTQITGFAGGHWMDVFIIHFDWSSLQASTTCRMPRLVEGVVIQATKQPR